VGTQVEMSEAEHASLFGRIQKQWTSYGESEPYASVLSSEQFLKENISENMHLLENSGNEVLRRLTVLAERNQVKITSGKCLELGCGVGRITKPLSKMFENVVAADISSSNLSVCKNYLNDANIQNVETLLLQSPEQIGQIEKIDVFVSIIVLQHNPPPVQYYLLDKILKNINSGGVAFFQTATFNPAYGYKVDYHLGMDTQAFESWSLHCLPMKYILQLLRRHGLEIIEVVEDGQSGGLQNRFHSHSFFAMKP
jgi:2-polyprenyl-3-methyl-5-hydroxy-6-metoxy-1,4-benzoquinol methylase